MVVAMTEPTRKPLADAVADTLHPDQAPRPPATYFRMAIEIDGKLYGFDGDVTAPPEFWMDKLTELAAAVRHHTGHPLWLGESEVESCVPEKPALILPDHLKH